MIFKYIHVHRTHLMGGWGEIGPLTKIHANMKMTQFPTIYYVIVFLVLTQEFQKILSNSLLLHTVHRLEHFGNGK